ncbi:MAG: lysylphosphatidylglycerol synthase domain-containing protein, partial [Pseudomonas sp.]
MNPAKPQHPAAVAKHRGWTLAKRGLTLGFFVLVLVLLALLARRLDWQEVLTTLRAYRPATLLLAAGATLASYLVYSSFDLLGRFYTRHQLHWRQVMPVTFVCYSFNLNLGSLVGGIAFRYRLYSCLGLGKGVITEVLTLSVMTNWLGYLCLAGALFALRLVELPPGWALGGGTLQGLGVLLLALIATYLLLCRLAHRRYWKIRGREIGLPSLPLSLTQIALGASNWALMALTVYILLGQRVDYPSVLGALLLGSIAGVITHIPAGLGVLEAVFIALLHHQISKGSLLAALIGYRVIYFLAPLLIAILTYLALEAKA